METPHAVTDPAKAQAIAASIEQIGWQGAPLVVWGDSLITGTHRYHAWTALLDRPSYDIPTIDLEDVFADAGLDFAALWQDEGEPTVEDAGVLLTHLPADVRDQYGIDWQ